MKSTIFLNLIFALFIFVKSGTTLALPLFLNQFFEPPKISSFIAILGLARLLSSFLFGYLADSFRKKNILIFSLILGMIAQIGLAFVGDEISAYGMILLDGIAFGIFFSVRSPLLLLVVPYSERGRQMGAISAISGIVGIVAGTVVGILLSKIGGRGVFLVFSLPFVISIFLAFSLQVKEPFVGKETSHRISYTGTIKAKIQAIQTGLWLILIVDFIQAFISDPLWSVLLPLYLHDIGNQSPGIIGIVYSLDSAFSIVSSFAFGKISDKKNPVVFLIIISVLMAALSGGISFSASIPILFIALYLLLSILFSGFSPVLEKTESEFIDEKYKGFNYMLVNIAIGLGSFLGNLFSGHFISDNRIGLFFLIIMSGYLVLIFLFAILSTHFRQ